MENKFLIDRFIETANYLDLEVYREYSGRGMSGGKCIGIILNRDIEHEIVDFILNFYKISKELNKEVCIENISKYLYFNTDSLGRDMIYYFKNIEDNDYERIDDDEDEDDEDDEDIEDNDYERTDDDEDDNDYKRTDDDDDNDDER